METQQFGIFDRPPEPPTGPETETRRAVRGFRSNYEAWRAGPGAESYSFIEREALNRLRNGDKRVSVNALAELSRATLKSEINNTFRAYIADDLVAEHPALLDVIERRRRTGHFSPNDPSSI